VAGKYLLPTGAAHMLNDLAFDADGAYLSDTTTGAIYRLTAELKELEVFVPPGTFRGPNGVAISDDGRYLYVASSGRGLSAVNLKTKAVSDLAVPEDVVAAGIDGLYFHRDSLVGIQNGIGPGRVMRYHLSAPTVIARAEILESRNPLFEVPTTGALCGDDFFYIANTQIDKTNAAGALTADANMKDIVILRLRL
jgi:sugar lactone lactonase YvrE